MAKPRALIVDDVALNVKLLALLMAANGYEIATAESAEAALDVLPTFLPRLLLLDLRLPGMDGLALTRQLRASAEFRDLTIIAVTASAMNGDEAVAIAAGCDAYVTKPVDTRAFPGTVAAVLERRGVR